GSEELSRFAGGVSELIPEPAAGISPVTAAEKGLENGDWVNIELDNHTIETSIKVIEGMADHVLLIPMGLDGFPSVIRNKSVVIKKADT
ncbi:MAG: hypothetical protein KFF73_16225, partial [Cyclobacteriaceae bacterium]|nr:hypothetical protein [Cyclobacteriaceae bacterium]